MRLPHSFLLQKKDFMIGLRWKTETQPENLLRKETKCSQPMQFPLNLPDNMFAWMYINQFIHEWMNMGTYVKQPY